MFSLKFVSATGAFSTLHKRVPAPYMRRSFRIDRLPERAEITVCGLGFYELYLNGEYLPKGLLAPYVSNPDDLMYYDCYDITDKLVPGENTFGFILGNGMLNCPGGTNWDFHKVRYRSAPKLAFCCEIDFPDGERLCFEADENVKCHPSPTELDDLRIGEFRNAQNEIEGWNLPGLDEDGWTAAIPAETPRGECRLCEAEPIVVERVLTPVSVKRGRIGKKQMPREKLPVIRPEGTEALETGWIYDFGENAAGNIRMKINGRSGQKVVLQYAEELNRDGNIDLWPMYALPEALNHRDIYICRGGGTEYFEPKFTYHGFRYCLVLGLEDEQATEELLSFAVMHSAVETVGGFRCSDGVLNRLQEIIVASDLANLFYVPTDCPHREKNGWTADAALSAEQMLLNFGVENTLREWMRSVCRAQRDDGALPGIVPTGGWGFHWGNGPAWDCVITEIPYMIWKYRGDREIIRENATAIFRYLNYLSTRRDDCGLIHIGLGDWCQSARNGSGNHVAPLVLTDTVISMDIARKAAAMFEAVGMRPQKVFADALYGEIRSAARRHLIDFNVMTALGACQTSQALAIHYDLFEEAEKAAAFRVLMKLIAENDGLMDVGVLGGRVLFRVLSRFGETDTALRMITTERYPSFGGWVRRGATSMWESFHPDGVYEGSHNHHFWGDLSGWMYEALAGIRFNPTGGDVRHVELRPCFATEIDSVSAFHDAPYGRIFVEWKRSGDEILLTVNVPDVCYGDIATEDGMMFSDGFRKRPLKSGVYRIIPSGKTNRT